MGVGGPMLVAVALFWLGLACLVPFVGGLLGFSRRIAYYLTAALVCGLILLDAWTFSDSLQHQNIYRLLFIDVAMTGLGAVELLLPLVLAHWLGALLRAGLVRVKHLLRSGAR